MKLIQIHEIEVNISDFRKIFKNSDESMDFTDLSPWNWFFFKVCPDGTPRQGFFLKIKELTKSDKSIILVSEFDEIHGFH